MQSPQKDPIPYRQYMEFRDDLEDAIDILDEEFQQTPDMSTRRALSVALARLLRVQTYILQHLDE